MLALLAFKIVEGQKMLRNSVPLILHYVMFICKSQENYNRSTQIFSFCRLILKMKSWFQLLYLNLTLCHTINIFKHFELKNQHLKTFFIFQTLTGGKPAWPRIRAWTLPSLFRLASLKRRGRHSSRLRLTTPPRSASADLSSPERRRRNSSSRNRYQKNGVKCFDFN